MNTYRVKFNNGDIVYLKAKTAHGASLLAERLYPQYNWCEVELYESL